MITPCYGAVVAGFPGFRGDVVVGDALFQLLAKAKDTRRLRITLMDLARAVAVSREIHRAVLVLDDPGITDFRLREEWAGAGAVIRPEVFGRLGAFIRRAGTWTGIPKAPSDEDKAILEDILKHPVARRPAGTGRDARAHEEILRILIHQWLLGKGPVSIGSLMAMAGASHPTVARSLRTLEHILVRHSDRSVELRCFPRDEWARLVAVSDAFRATARFVDRSGRARSPESLMRRLRALGRRDIALGGVLGAIHYLPALDIAGIPRLDLTVHAERQVADLSFVQRLDPALERATRPDEAPALVVHSVRRAHSLFQPSDSGVPWADPVECLLDLHEARLEPQAMEFLQSFLGTRESIA